MEKTEIKNQIKTIYILYWAMFLSVVLLTFLAGFIVSSQEPFLETDQQTAYIFYLILVVILAINIPLSYLLPQKMIRGIRGIQKPLVRRLSMYRTAMIVRFAVLNSAGFLVAIWFMFFGNVHLFYVQVIILLIFLMYKPSPFKIAVDLELDDRESEMLIRGEE